MKNPKLDKFFKGPEKWQAELRALRAIALDLPLTEEVKWGQPCYTLEGRNVFLITAFKNYALVMFVKGALLKDAKKLLIQAGENTQSARQMRFTGIDEIKKQRATIKSYMLQAMKVEQAGLEVAFKEISEFKVPAEFQAALDKSNALKKAFDSLTPGRRRAYLMHFTAAKQAATRLARIDKCRPLILAGQGLNDSYVKSKR